MPASQSLDLISLFNLLLSRWRFLIFATLGIMVVAGIGTYLTEETYESSAKLLVSSPKFATGLDVFPQQLNEPTFGQMAQSGVVYEDLIQVMRALEELLIETRNDKEAAIRKANEILQSSTEELAQRFGWDPLDAKIRAVQTLSPRDIAGIRLIEPEAFELMDTRTLSQILDVKSEIEFEGPNVIRWEPLIELSARSNTPETAASIANIWAHITLEHVRAVVELGTRDALQQLTEAYGGARQALDDVQQQIKQLNQTEMGEIRKKRLQGILDVLYGYGMAEANTAPFYRQYAEAEARTRELRRSIEDLRQHLSSLEVDGEWIGSLSLAPGDSQPAPLPQESTAAHETGLRRNALLRAYRALREFKEQNPIETETTRLAEAVQSLEDLRSERSTFAAMAKVSPSIADATGEMERFDARIAQVEQMIAETSDKIAAMEEGLNEKEMEVTRAEKEWTAYREEYVRLLNELFSRQEELLSKRALTESLHGQIQKASDEMTTLNTEIQEYNSRLAGLEADLAAKRKAYDEITALHAQVQVASRTPFVSLKLVSAAPIPKTRVSPNRRLVVLVAGFIGFVLLSAWLIVRENLRRYREAQTAA